MYNCKTCNYFTNNKYDYKKHCNTIKHLNIINKFLEDTSNLTNKIQLFKCDICNKKYKHKNNLIRHNKKCISLLEKIKDENCKLKYDHEKKLLEVENYHLKQKINESNTYNTQIINNNTIINYKSKVQYLNANFNDVIDIKTFIDNYKTQYGLSNNQTKILLENYKDGGINTCISTLVHYLKESAIKQYKEIKGKEIEKMNVILPFILADKSLRDHFEKKIDGLWDKTTMIDNIKTIVGITDDHIYKHHNTYMFLSDAQKKKLINGVLKASGFSKLSEISIPDLYKKINNTVINPPSLTA